MCCTSLAVCLPLPEHEEEEKKKGEEAAQEEAEEDRFVSELATYTDAHAHAHTHCVFRVSILAMRQD